MRKAWALPAMAAAVSLMAVPAASADQQAPAAAPAMEANLSHSKPWASAQEGPSADELLAKLENCDQLSDGAYAPDVGEEETIPVCGVGDAVFWQGDMDIDCDGQRTEQCNEETDPWWQNQTAFQDSNGEHLNAAELPFIVVPGASSKFDYTAAGITGGTVGAVIYEGKVQYAVVGDVGPTEAIGEASWATADKLGIDPDPATGGTPEGVSYVLFPGAEVDALEDQQAAVDKGVEAANALVNG